MCTAHFLLYRKVRPIKQKMLRMDAHSREEKGVACATALGARVSQAKLFVLPKRKDILESVEYPSFRKIFICISILYYF